MTELSGTLEGVGLPAIVRFLAGLRKTGALRVTHNDWHGDIYFDSGRVVSAQLGSRRGLQALDALVQALPGGSFVFDIEAKLPEKHDLELTQEALMTHLDDLAKGAPVLPSLDAVPRVVPQAEDTAEEDTVPLDRGTLQTLIAVDGFRTVREIISVRGSFEALWQLANLADVGLVRLSPGTEVRQTPKPIEPPKPVEPPQPKRAEPQRPEPQRPEPRRTAPVEIAAPPRPIASVAPVVPIVTPAATALTSCPKLGFEDDPGSSFARPTRLHRCFAAGTPLPLSLDQQRELCLTDQYGTCPRLAMAGLTPSMLEPVRTDPVASAPVTPVTPAAPVVPVAPVAPSKPEAPTAAEPEPAAPTNDPRIVRLPIGGRGRPAAHITTPVETTPAPTTQPTPLRTVRVRNGAHATAVIAEPAAKPEAAPESAPPAPPQRPTRAAAAVEATPPRRRLIARVPSTTLAAGAVVLIVIAVVAALLIPRLNDAFTDEQGVDLSSLPNTSAAIAGTPVSELPSAKPTLATAAAPASATAQAPLGEPTSAPLVKPTAVPTIAPTAAPTVAPTPAGPRTLLEESFADNSRNWASNPQGVAWITAGALHLAPKQAGQFVALGIPPVGEIAQDVTISGTFHKTGGPAGGGYGFIVRDQGPGPRDGVNQIGRYYVLEVGDKGEIGIWRRDGDRWIDLLPWQRSDAVKPGSSTNEVTVRASGDRLSLSVNGTEVGVRNDGALAVGNVGIFVGGDANQVVLENLTVKTP